MNILTLDLGTQMGWAVISDNHKLSGTVGFKTDRFSGGGMPYLRFKKWLTEVKNNAGDLDAVFFEEVRRHQRKGMRTMPTDAAHVYGGFLATLTAWCEHHEIPYQGVPVGTIKRHATGKGNCGKLEMIAAAKKLGFDPEDDNEADAIHILDWAIKNYKEVLEL